MKKFISKIAKISALFLFFPATAGAAEPTEYECSFLAIADAQYSDSAPRINRNYRLSAKKIEAIFESEKSGSFDFVVNLGDTIDGGFENYARILPLFEKFPYPLYNLLGNHDFACTKEEQTKAVNLLFKDGKTHYSFDVRNWKFMALDPMRLSEASKIKPPECAREYGELIAKMTAEEAVNAKPWNGGIDAAQLQWLRKQLSQAQSENKNVVVFCHMPVYPLTSESLYNWRELSETLAKFPCVKAYISGHRHKGGYACENGIHYITVCGLVEGTAISYARIFLSKNSIRVEGFGNTKSLDLKLR